MNAIFKSSLSNTARRSALLVACLAIAALGLVAVPTHKALAVAPTGFTSVDYRASDNTGVVTRMVVVLNGTAPLTVCNVADAELATDWTYVANGLTGTSILSATCDLATKTITFVITGGTTITGAASAPTLAYDNDDADGSIANTDAALGAVVAADVTDNMAPVLLSVVKSVVSSQNVLTFNYSEPMAVTNGASSATAGDTTTAGTVAGFASFATAGDITVPTTKNTIGGDGTAAITVTLAAQAAGYMATTSTTEPNGVVTPVASAGTEVIEDAVGAKKVNTAYNGAVVTLSPVGNTTWDLTKPTITSVTLADAVGNNGKVDRATVVFSSTIKDASITDADALLGGGVNTGTFTSGAANDATTAFNLTADTLATNTSATAAEFSYSAATTKITDLAGNLLNTAVDGAIADADAVEVDGANPVLTAVATTVTGSRNVINFTYSEPMTTPAPSSTASCGDLTTVGTVEGIGNFVTNGDVVVNTVKNSLSASTNVVTVTLANVDGGFINAGASIVPSGNVAPLACSGVVDAVNLQANTSGAVVASSAGSAWVLTMPTLTSVTLSDADYDGRVDTASALFSAAMRDSNVSVANASLGGATVTLTGTANDVTLAFFYAGDALAISTTANAADFLYSGVASKLTDLYGNMLDAAADGVIATGIVELDNAPPVIATASPAADATAIALGADIVLTFSEAMNGPGTSCTFSSSPDPGGWNAITNAANWSNGDKTVTLTHSLTYTRGSHPTITVGGCTAAVTGLDGALHTNGNNPLIFAVVASGSSAGGGSYTPPSPSVLVSLPNGGETVTTGQQVGISWSSADGAFAKFKVSYSADNGNNWTVIADNVSNSSTSYTWVVPSASTTQGLIKVEGIDHLGVVIASDVSNAVFTIAGLTVAPPPVAPPVTVAPAVDPTVHGSYTAAEARANNPSIADDKSLVPVSNANCTAGSLIKASLPAVYYCGADGKRYVFVNDKAYFSWYADFSTVLKVTDAVLASITIGGNITYRPGSKMVKVMSDPKTYAVARGGVLRWIQTEAAAIRLYGATWNKQIDDVADSFFVNYKIGDPITQ